MTRCFEVYVCELRYWETAELYSAILPDSSDLATGLALTLEQLPNLFDRLATRS
jgi:hypothetical protein